MGLIGGGGTSVDRRNVVEPLWRRLAVARLSRLGVSGLLEPAARPAGERDGTFVSLAERSDLNSRPKGPKNNDDLVRMCGSKFELPGESESAEPGLLLFRLGRRVCQQSFDDHFQYDLVNLTHPLGL